MANDSPPVPSCRALSSRQWALPLPSAEEWARRFPGGLRWKETVQAFADLGFQVLHHAQSVSHWQLDSPCLRASQEARESLRDFVVWWHPAGVLVTGNSSWAEPSSSPVLNELNVSVEIDVGTNSDVAEGKALRIDGSYLHPMADGTSRCIATSKWSQGSHWDLEFLRRAQGMGRLLPVEEWCTQTAPFLAPEMLAPVLDVNEIRNYSKDIRETALRMRQDDGGSALLRSLPPALRPPFERELELPIFHVPRAARVDRMDLERVHRQVSEVLFLGHHRFPSQKARASVTHWMEVAQGQHGEDPSKWRAQEKGPGGLSLATVLLYFSLNSAAQSRLHALFRWVSEETVRSWVQDVDAAGYTLGLRIIHRALAEQKPGSWGLLGELTALETFLETLWERAGPGAVRLVTPQRSPLGLFCQVPPTDLVAHKKGLSEQQTHALRLLQKCDRLGLDWGPETSRWRSFPSEPGRPAPFCRTEGLAAWAKMADRQTEAGLEIERWLCAQHRHTRLGETCPPALGRSRPRF